LNIQFVLLGERTSQLAIKREKRTKMGMYNKLMWEAPNNNEATPQIIETAPAVGNKFYVFFSSILWAKWCLEDKPSYLFPGNDKPVECSPQMTSENNNETLNFLMNDDNVKKSAVGIAFRQFIGGWKSTTTSIPSGIAWIPRIMSRFASFCRENILS
jgi:hypothetical protein